MLSYKLNAILKKVRFFNRCFVLGLKITLYKLKILQKIQYGIDNNIDNKYLTEGGNI